MPPVSPVARPRALYRCHRTLGAAVRSTTGVVRPSELASGQRRCHPKWEGTTSTGAGVGVGTSVGTGTAVSATVSGLPGRTTVLEPLSPGSPTAGLITGLNRKPCRCRSTSDLSPSKSKLMNVVWPSASSKFPTSLIVSLGTSAVISSPSFSICTSGTERRTCVYLPAGSSAVPKTASTPSRASSSNVISSSMTVSQPSPATETSILSVVT